MLNTLKPAATLLIVTLVAAVALGFVYMITLEPIQRQKAKVEADTVAALLPDTETTESQDIAEGIITRLTTCYAGGNVVGYAVSAAPKGYGGTMGIMVAFDTAGVLQGVQITSHSETPGLGADAARPKFTDQFKGKNETLKVVKSKASASDEIEAITSATITSDAVTAGVNAAMDFIQQYIN